MEISSVYYFDQILPTDLIFLVVAGYLPCIKNIMSITGFKMTE
jgi:hypothetical protein